MCLRREVDGTFVSVCNETAERKQFVCQKSYRRSRKWSHSVRAESLWTFKSGGLTWSVIYAREFVGYPPTSDHLLSISWLPKIMPSHKQHESSTSHLLGSARLHVQLNSSHMNIFRNSLISFQGKRPLGRVEIFIPLNYNCVTSRLYSQHTIALASRRRFAFRFLCSPCGGSSGFWN